MTYFRHRKVYSIIVTLSLFIMLSLAPTQKAYANDLTFGANGTLNGIMVKTVGVALGILSAIGFSNVQGAYDAYDTKVVKPIVNYLKKYEVSDGKMKAYYKDGKTYVDKEVIQGVVDYATTNNMFTDINTSSADLVLGNWLEPESIMDINSFLMAVPYISGWKEKYSTKYDEMINKMGVPYLAHWVSGQDKCYLFGIITADKKSMGSWKYAKEFSHFKMGERDIQNRRTLEIQFSDNNFVNVGSNFKCYYNGKIVVNSKGITYSTVNGTEGYYGAACFIEAGSGISEFGYRIGLTKQIISEPACTVADPALAGQQIDNWDTAWAQNVIDVLRDIAINTSIDAGAVAGADADRKGLALPVTLPQYGIDANTETEAWERTASLGMDVAKTGEVALSPSAIEELSQAIAEATGEAVHEATGDITISIPEAKYNGLDDYKLVLTEVFPFCIPFDLIDLVKVFSATPQAPKFSLPIKYPTGFNSWDSYDLEIDLSVFDGVATVVRTLETVLFILGLIKITRGAMIRG